MDLSVSRGRVTLAPQTGASVTLETGDTLRVGAPTGRQVADLALFGLDDTSDSFSPGRTMDYNERLVPQRGDVLYSNRSTALAEIVEDTAGVHDLLLSPCSETMFARRGQFAHPSCHENLYRALEPHGLGADDVRATLNVFMDVRVDGNAIVIFPPPNTAADIFALRARVPLIVAISACSSEKTNDGRCKPVWYEVVPRS